MADAPVLKRGADGEGTAAASAHGEDDRAPNKRPRNTTSTTTTTTATTTTTTTTPVAPEKGEGSIGAMDDQSSSSPTPSSPPAGAGGGPQTIVTYNINGGGPRMANNWEELSAFLAESTADLVCFQEFRLPAKGVPKCKKDDDTGRKRGQLKDDTAADRKDIGLFQKTLMSLARRLGYRVLMSLANYKYAGTAVLIRNTCPAVDVFYNIAEDGQLVKEHDREGRVIAIEYPSVTVVMLYAPNNGVKPESFKRREKWDLVLRGFVNGYVRRTGRPVIITGDLNVAHTDADLTHPSYFKGMFPAATPQNSGQPGCTPAEKGRHSLLLESGGGLVDAYRHLHPAGAAGAKTGTDTEGMTWRGTAGNQVAASGRYYGKGMRIDYFLVSKSLAPRIKEVKVFGKGADREGFLGSDHSPLMLTLLPSP